jgi:hypothetical protein
MKPVAYLRDRDLRVLSLAMAYARVLGRGKAPEQYRRPKRAPRQMPLLFDDVRPPEVSR